MTRAEEITARIAELNQEIAELARKGGRYPEEIVLLAVTKQRTIEEVQATIAAGLENLGESRVQEAEMKIPYITAAVTSHMIGHLQTNKVNRAAHLFNVVQSVDSIHLAKALDRRASDEGLELDIYLEINSSGEPQKSGIEPVDFWELADYVVELPCLHLEGLMTVGPMTDSEDDIKEAFDLTRSLFDSACARGFPLRMLSMGMSADYPLAIAAGANLVRLGTAIYVPRS